MLSFIDLSEIDVTSVERMEFGKSAATIFLIDGSFIEIDYDKYGGMDYNYWDSDGKYYRIVV